MIQISNPLLWFDSGVRLILAGWSASIMRARYNEVCAVALLLIVYVEAVEVDSGSWH
jgi:hypothetical protein